MRSLGNWQILIYGILTMPLAMASLVIVVIVPTYYAIDRGLGLAVVGTVFAAGRFLDVVTDPLAGYLSDETRSRFGARRPWLAVGLPAIAISSWLLFNPPEGAGLLYLAIVSAAFFIAYTILEVPYASIGLEISPHVHERSLLASSRAAFQVLGAIAVSAILLLYGGANAAALRTITFAMAALAAVGVLLIFLFLPDRRVPVEQIRTGFGARLRLVMANPAFRRLALTFFVIQSANALFAGLAILFITKVIGDESMTGPTLGAMFISTALFLPLWLFLSRRLGKNASWAISMVAGIALFLVIPFLGQGDIVAAIIIFALLGGVFGCDIIMPTSMLADIVFAAGENSGTRLGATYHAMKNAASKITFLAPAGIAFPILGMIGFDSHGSNGSFQIHVFVFFFAIAPAVLRLISLLLLRQLTSARSVEGGAGARTGAN